MGRQRLEIRQRVFEEKEISPATPRLTSSQNNLNNRLIDISCVAHNQQMLPQFIVQMSHHLVKSVQSVEERFLKSQIQVSCCPDGFHAGRGSPVESARSDPPLKDPCHQSQLVVDSHRSSPTSFDTIHNHHSYPSICINSVQLDAWQHFEKNKSYKHKTESAVTGELQSNIRP